MASVKTQLKQGGRIIIPRRFRAAMGVKAGDDVVLMLENDEVRVVTPRQAVKRAQALVRQCIQKGRSLGDELIHERRREVRGDARKKPRVTRRA